MFSTFIAVLSLINPYTVDASVKKIFRCRTCMKAKVSSKCWASTFWQVLKWRLSSAMLIGFIAPIARGTRCSQRLPAGSVTASPSVAFLGYIFYPVAWVMGVPSSEALQVEVSWRPNWFPTNSWR
ncbi:hypothetical protein KCP77_09525 [Salmonella enterica subsp. enterica]|nr:hypothetical protein KCP77_09525 [Salmonella enterica subsp. enterica]